MAKSSLDGESPPHTPKRFPTTWICGHRGGKMAILVSTHARTGVILAMREETYKRREVEERLRDGTGWDTKSATSTRVVGCDGKKRKRSDRVCVGGSDRRPLWSGPRPTALLSRSVFFFSLFSLLFHSSTISIFFILSPLINLITMSSSANQRATVILNHLSASATHPAGLLANQVAIVTGAGYVANFCPEQRVGKG